MSSAEGAAIRIQLDALRADLQARLGDAARYGDVEVIKLISKLTEAHDLACAIDFRRRPGRKRGVILAKR